MTGLTDKEVEYSRKKYGSNKIVIKNENKFIRKFIEALGDPIIKIMLIAVLIRFIFLFKDANWYETVGMLISILLSTMISSLSEYGSNKSFESLQKEYESIIVKVKRNNKIVEIDNDDVVVGDIVIVQTGDKVCADGIIIDGSIGVDEKSINGESEEVIKSKNDIVLKGSVVLSNQAIIKINKVGINTVYGNIAKELNEKEPDSPMKIRLKNLANTISKIGIIGAVLVSISYFINVVFIYNNFDISKITLLLSNINYDIDLIVHCIILSLTIIIVCVPEGLPLMIALVLSSNMKRMLKNNVLVRKSVGIETCGSMNVLLFDKTGTITYGKLNMIGFMLGNGYKYNNVNEMKDDLKVEIIDSIKYNIDSVYEDNNIVGGNSTDKALLNFIGKNTLFYKIKNKINFNSENKYSSVTLDNNIIYYKGAVEVLLNKCIYYLDEYNNRKIIKDKNDIISLVDKYTSKGMRLICVVKNNILIGFSILSDTLRENAYSSIKNINKAGISTIMITGDSLLTAKYIALELGIIDSNSIILDHDMLSNKNDKYIIDNYKNIKVIARALPSDKSRIASVLEKSSLVVGMSGDGVNDAPALKKASVGISLGSGCEVAKEASDIVILDDNIESIEKAILYGRTIFKSIRKFIIFQLTINFCALVLSIIGPFIGVTTPVTIMQMLWLNMIMDTLAGIAFSYCPVKKEYLNEMPIKKDEKILNKYMYISIATISLYLSILLILFLKLDIIKLFIRSDNNIYMTGFFSLFIFSCIFNAFNARTSRLNIFENIFNNKIFVLIMSFIFIAQIYIIYYGGSLFRTYGLNIKELLFIIVLSLNVIVIDFIKKVICKKIKI